MTANQADIFFQRKMLATILLCCLLIMASGTGCQNCDQTCNSPPCHWTCTSANPCKSMTFRCRTGAQERCELECNGTRSCDGVSIVANSPNSIIRIQCMSPGACATVRCMSTGFCQYSVLGDSGARSATLSCDTDQGGTCSFLCDQYQSACSAAHFRCNATSCSARCTDGSCQNTLLACSARAQECKCQAAAPSTGCSTTTIHTLRPTSSTMQPSMMPTIGKPANKTIVHVYRTRSNNVSAMIVILSSVGVCLLAFGCGVILSEVRKRGCFAAITLPSPRPEPNSPSTPNRPKLGHNLGSQSVDLLLERHALQNKIVRQNRALSEISELALDRHLTVPSFSQYANSSPSSTQERNLTIETTRISSSVASSETDVDEDDLRYLPELPESTKARKRGRQGEASICLTDEELAAHIVQRDNSLVKPALPVAAETPPGGMSEGHTRKASLLSKMKPPMPPQVRRMNGSLSGPPPPREFKEPEQEPIPEEHSLPDEVVIHDDDETKASSESGSELYGTDISTPSGTTGDLTSAVFVPAIIARRRATGIYPGKRVPPPPARPKRATR